MRSNEVSTPELTWVLPLYRTRAQLDELVRRVTATCERIGEPCEVVLVDDACPQGCADHLTERGLPTSMRVIRLPVRQGQDAALRAGLRAARGEWAVLLDADLQDPPEAVADLWERRDPQVDAVFAHRQGRYERGARLLSSRVYRSLASWLGGLPEGAGLFVLLHRRVIDRVLARDDRAPSMLADIAANGRRFSSTPILRVARSEGESAYTGPMRLRRALTSLLGLAEARVRRRTSANL